MSNIVEEKSMPGQQRIRYLPKPDYSKPLLEIPREAQERMLDRLRFLYGYIVAQEIMP